MPKTKLHIKNMVCPRCVTAVETSLSKLNIEFSIVQLGEVSLLNPLNPQEKADLVKELKHQGFELLDDKKGQLIESIKNAIIQMVHYQDDPDKIGHLSKQLPQILGHSYSYLSTFFSELEGVTIEKFLIRQKIEKAKELLTYSELNISEISYQLNYSSSQHFSQQFKTITGMSPSEFSKRKDFNRKPLNEI